MREEVTGSQIQELLQLSIQASGMPSPEVNSKVDNWSSGSQFFAHGHGDQNVASGDGVQYNDRSDRRNITSAILLS